MTDERVLLLVDWREETLDGCDLADLCEMLVLFLTELLAGDLLVTDERVLPDLTVALPTEGLLAVLPVTDPDDLLVAPVFLFTE